MWSKQPKEKTEKHEADAPEKLRYSRYYEHDGVLRAYANRAMVLAFLCVPVAMLALGFAVYVRLQPPTVIRVSEGRQWWSDRRGPRSRSLGVQARSRRNLRNEHSCERFSTTI